MFSPAFLQGTNAPEQHLYISMFLFLYRNGTNVMFVRSHARAKVSRLLPPAEMKHLFFGFLFLFVPLPRETAFLYESSCFSRRICAGPQSHPQVGQDIRSSIEGVSPSQEGHRLISPVLFYSLRVQFFSAIVTSGLPFRFECRVLVRFLYPRHRSHFHTTFLLRPLHPNPKFYSLSRD